MLDSIKWAYACWMDEMDGRDDGERDAQPYRPSIPTQIRMSWFPTALAFAASVAAFVFGVWAVVSIVK